MINRIKLSHLCFILLVSSFQIHCTTEVTEVIEKTVVANPAEMEIEVIEKPIILETEEEFEDSTNLGFEFGNPSPAPLPKPSEELDGIEFSNPELPSKSQKGPFYMDSDIFIQEIKIEDHDFKLTGNIYIDRVSDNLGSFNLPSDLASPYLEIRVNGYYFNEITGGPSDGTISLGSYSSIKDGKAPNINILTTLAQKRIKYLVKEGQLSFEAAETQAKTEVLNAFFIQDDISNFDELKIDGNSNGDAALLAISVILQGDLSTVELSNFIANIREDLRDNGIIDSEEINQQICHQTRGLNPLEIRENLTEFYESLSIEGYDIPIFEDYLDSDCNGILNKNDSQSLIFLKKKSPFEIYHREGLSLQVYQDKVWALGENLDIISYTSDLKEWDWIIADEVLNTTFPIMINWRGLLYIFGGQYSIRDEDDNFTKIDSLGVLNIDEELNVETVKERVLDNSYQDFVRAHLNRSLRDNIYPNFSSINHIYFIYNNEVYMLPKKSYDSNYYVGSKKYQKTSDGINWQENQITEFLENLYGSRTVYTDAIFFSDQLYTISSPMINLPLYINQISISNDNINLIIGRDLSLEELSNLKYFTKYDEYLFISNEYHDQPNRKIGYTSDGENWSVITIPYDEEFFDIHKPIVFQNMIHTVMNNDTILIYGFYKYYKEYIGVEETDETLIPLNQNDLFIDAETISQTNINPRNFSPNF